VLLWKKGVPQEVRNLVDVSVNWLRRYILTKEYRHMNAFFSGSVKGFSSVPFWYPANFFQLLNGTDVNPSKFDLKDSMVDELVIGVRGGK